VSDLVVDASVAVKWLVPEPHADAAHRALTAAAYSLIAPDLIWPEVGNALWKKWRRGELTDDEPTRLLHDLGRAPVKIVASRVLADSAWMFALQYRRPFYDSLYLALASAVGCSLLTADRRLYDALNGTPLAEHLLWLEDLPAVIE
jgi:predicted nucleic acid-binding protein